ncbi:MAG: hypothetical protein IJP41_08665, partial [Synergistaceae bacterium]|nr:hypothetical protein [Synergistaceae bacterium]
MRKIFLTIVIILTTLILSSVSFGAVSEDMNVYVRQDVFDAKMEALFEPLHGEMDRQFAEIKGEIRSL